MEAILAFFFGLLAGSFLNVCIHRWPRGRSVVKPRSHCVRCRKTIAWYDNIPLVSYAVLRGRCRHCGKRISARYPLVELVTGLLFFYFVFTLGPTPAAIKMCVFTAMLVALMFCDLEKRILPDELTMGGAAAGFVFALFVPVPDITASALLWVFGVELGGAVQSLAESVCGSLLPALVLWGGGWLYYKVRHREGLGFGATHADYRLDLRLDSGLRVHQGYRQGRRNLRVALRHVPGRGGAGGCHRGTQGAGVVRGAVGGSGCHAF